MPVAERDVLHNIPLLKTAVRLTLARQKGVGDIGDFNLKFHKVGEDRYEAETDLMKKSALGVEDVHEALKAAVLAIGGVDQRIGEMQAHTALSGFVGEELPLFRSKLEGLAELAGSQKRSRDSRG